MMTWITLAGVLTVLGAGTDVPAPSFHPTADLPPLMAFADGRPVKTMDDWAARRDEIRRLMIETFIGTFPDKAPAVLSADILEERKEKDESTRRRVRLTFDTPHKASFEMWVWIPKGTGPFPVLLVAPRYYQLVWAERALARGYIVGLFPGVDSHHKEDAYPGYERVWEDFRKEYPNATWTEISTKAWLAGRALDYLLDPRWGYNAAPGQAGIIGHSRYGKQSLIAGAFDDRITSVVARSPGSPASCPYRFTSRNTFNEAPPDFPDEWFLPGLREYYGREDELPIDAHGWLALIAPKRCLIHTAYGDDCEPTFAVERAYREGSTVYAFLGKPENLRVQYREGYHNPITDEHARQNMDWFDLSFGRGTAKQEEFPEQFLHTLDWNAWKSKQSPAELSTAAVKDASVPERIAWMLGAAPARVAWDGQYRYTPEEDVKERGYDNWNRDAIRRIPVSFGEGIPGHVYVAKNVDGPRPAVVWLHPYSYPTGFNEAYGIEEAPVFASLAARGFIVLAYDQCGFGVRLLEGRDFYDQYPHWSRLGRMVHDARCAVDFLVDGKGQAQADMPKIDTQHVYVLGYSMGGMVALYTAAQDLRVAGVASFCGFTPMRTDTDAKSTGGIRRLWEWHALQPRLGLFQGRESEIPYDFDDVLGLIAPRPCLVVAPAKDRDADAADVGVCAARARRAWKQAGKPDAFDFRTPDDTNRFQRDQQVMAAEWLAKLTQP